MSDWYNRTPFAAHTRITAEAMNRELTKVAAALDQLPAPNAVGTGEGSPNYTHYAYADSADGSANFTTGASDGRSYVGVQTNTTSATPSAFYEDYTWSRLTGEDGDDGTDGTDGEYREFRFIRSLFAPTAATGNAPAGTYAEPPIGTDPLWATSAQRNGAGMLISAWSPWERISAMPAAQAYNAATTYYRDMQVLFGGGTYILIVASSVGNAPTGTGQANAQWAVIAAPGDPGEPASPPSAFSATIALTTSTAGANLRTIADANGYTGQSDATVTFNVPNAVTVTGAAGGGIGIDSGVWPSSSYTIALTLVVQSGGVVHGGGGAGGAGGSGTPGIAGTAGGDAVYLREAVSGGITIDAGGVVRAGGGGGGGGGAASGTYFLAPGEPEYGAGAGGGGGGGFPNGSAGIAGLDSDSVSATNGSAGTTGGGGAGGAGRTAHGFVGAAGGAGGTFAAAGTSGTAASGNNGGAGGPAGYAVRKNGFTATVTNNGTMSGTAA